MCGRTHEIFAYKLLLCEFVKTHWQLKLPICVQSIRCKTELSSTGTNLVSDDNSEEFKIDFGKTKLLPKVSEEGEVVHLFWCA